jgi:hypothetical protein
VTALTSLAQSKGTLSRTVLTGEVSVFLPVSASQKDAFALLELVRPITHQHAQHCQAPRLSRLEGHRVILVTFASMSWRSLRRLQDVIFEATGCPMGRVYQLQRQVSP